MVMKFKKAHTGMTKEQRYTGSFATRDAPIRYGRTVRTNAKDPKCTECGRVGQHKMDCGKGSA